MIEHVRDVAEARFEAFLDVLVDDGADADPVRCLCGLHDSDRTVLSQPHLRIGLDQAKQVTASFDSCPGGGGEHRSGPEHCFALKPPLELLAFDLVRSKD